jgi:hypothetical protein
LPEYQQLFDKPHRSTPKNNHPGVTTTLRPSSLLTRLLLSRVSGNLQMESYTVDHFKF